MSDICTGISGWTYPRWRGVLYPEKLRQRDELAYASSKFRTIEIDGTFYRNQSPHSFLKWYETGPEDFVFSVKAPRFIPHILRLKDVETPLANFFASGILRLRQKLRAVLWQFPPSMKFDEKLFLEFLAVSPKDSEKPALLAKRHDLRMKNWAWSDTDEKRKLRHAGGNSA